jgi:hypothetical protein
VVAGRVVAGDVGATGFELGIVDVVVEVVVAGDPSGTVPAADSGRSDRAGSATRPSPHAPDPATTTTTTNIRRTIVSNPMSVRR